MKKFYILILTMLCFFPPIFAFSQEMPKLPKGLEKKDSSPSLPKGLKQNNNEPSIPQVFGEDSGPSLPTGLGEDLSPSLPTGLGGDAGIEKADTSDAEKQKWYSITGFAEARGGIRTQSDPYEDDVSIEEFRLQIGLETQWKEMLIRLRPDILLDPVMDEYDIDLEDGRGVIDLREASLSVSLFSFMDLKIGRQILTWGTGDMLFINDMFPKDWQSFFIGRDDEYLKAPSDAFKVSLFSKVSNLDIVYTPRFDADRSPCGKRLSYYNRLLARRAGEDAVINPDKPDDWFNDDEWALRLYKTIHGIELAAYAYWGFWKGASGMDPISQTAQFTALNVYGASVRGQIFSGIANLELGYYDSHDDSSGDNPWIDNGQFRILIGYDRDFPEVLRDFKAGIQYYVEHVLDYDEYEKTLPPGTKLADKDRHVITLRLTKQFWNQNLSFSLFAYYSPTDEDAYLRPNITYKIDDHWTASIGGNAFPGKEDHTFFGQFERNSNIYAGLRYGF